MPAVTWRRWGTQLSARVCGPQQYSSHAPPPPHRMMPALCTAVSSNTRRGGKKSKNPPFSLEARRSRLESRFGSSPPPPPQAAPPRPWNAMRAQLEGGGGTHRDEQSFTSEMMITNRQTKRYEQKQHHLYIYIYIKGSLVSMTTQTSI